MGSTKIELVQDLENTAIGNEQHSKVRAIIEKAESGYYHDFDTPIATPKIQLHTDLLDAGLVEIDKKMQDGDYDDELPTPEQEKRMLTDLASDVRSKKEQ